MFGIILKTTVLSIVFIYIVHQIIQYLTDTITVPKTKDLVSIIEKKYDEIHKTLSYAPTNPPPNTTSLTDLPITSIVPIDSPLSTGHIDMKSELQLFINQAKM
jgi:hypothetical protein